MSELRRTLTAHELAVAREIAAAKTNREIAEALSMSPKTVESHLGSIYRKLQLRSRVELAVLVVRCEEK